jgi:membrane protease YdiL (CAAX protease family)
LAAAHSIKRCFGFSLSSELRRQPLPIWKVFVFSFGILAAFFIGTVLESRLRSTGYGEALGAIPVLICAAFVLRLPPPAAIRVRCSWRAILLLLPFAILAFADFALPEFSPSQTGLWLVVIVQALGVGIAEELTFRFGLHRLWSHYGALFYVFASSTIFAVGHYPLGLQISLVSGVIGAAFAASRAAGMPLIPLIILHAFLDTPEFFRTTVLN